MEKVPLSDEMKEKVTGGLGKKSSTASLVEKKEVVCKFCGGKYTVLKTLVDYSCPHCGYGGFKTLNDTLVWEEKHKNKNI